MVLEHEEISIHEKLKQCKNHTISNKTCLLKAFLMENV